MYRVFKGIIMKLKCLGVYSLFLDNPAWFHINKMNLRWPPSVTYQSLYSFGIVRPRHVCITDISRDRWRHGWVIGGQRLSNTSFICTPSTQPYVYIRTPIEGSEDVLYRHISFPVYRKAPAIYFSPLLPAAHPAFTPQHHFLMCCWIYLLSSL